MARYSDILRGPELAAAYTAYQAYLALDRTQKKAKYKALNVTRLVAVRKDQPIAPFGSTNLMIPMGVPVDNPAPDVTATSAEQKEADTGLVGTINGILGARSNSPVVEADQVIRIPKFKAAQLFLTRKTGTSSTEQTSRFTNIPYKRYQTNTISSPFGKSTANDTYDAAVAAILASTGLTTHLTSGGKYRLVPQRSIIA